MASSKNIKDDLADWIDALENKLLFDGESETKELANEFINYLQNKNLVDDIHLNLPLRIPFLV